MNKRELTAKIDTLQTELKDLFGKAKDANGEFKMTSDALAEAEARETELGDLNKKLFEVNKVEQMAKRNEEYLANNTKAAFTLPHEGSDAPRGEVKSFGQQIVDAGTLKGLNSPSVTLADVELKTLMSTGAGWAPESIRSGVVALSPQRALTLLDYLPSITVNQAAYKYMLESTFTNSAAETAESVDGTLNSYPESALALTETTALIQKIPTFLPVSDEQIEDVPGITEYLNQRLSYMVKARFEGQLIAGNGTAPNIRGMINVSGVNTQAKSTDDTFTAIYKGITKIRVNGQTEPNLILMHPNDWQDIRVLQASTGQFIFENPALAGDKTLFGIPVILSTAVTENTAVLLDSFYNMALMRRGVDVQFSNSHASYFIQGVQAVRADMRGGFACLRPKSICTVTGI